MPCIAIDFDPRLNQLILPIYLSRPAIVLAQGEKPVIYPCNALIDTGASHSCISTSIARDMSLYSTGKTYSHTAAGLSEVDKYYVDLHLPFGGTVFVVSNQQMSSYASQEHFDILLGMDIIGQGHLSVDAFAGRFTFCV